ncbi:activator-dependent family glycosyltransferase [Amycolatopsis sp. NPDC059027]|uniref:activator-dependent family glycosyltransferase n=1 Tax=unclassified Amycolatopsis TaxID=2618356 RepID=UPI00366E7127
MKVLFATLPYPTHFYPMVPLAWALRTAGHEVRVASQPDLTDVITGSGLTAVPVGRPEAESPVDDLDSAELLEALHEDGSMYVYLFDLTGNDRTQWSDERLLSLEHIQTPALLSVINSDPVVDDLVDFARGWRPDLVVWEPFTFAGAIAARVTGAAHARLVYAPDATVRVRQEFLRAQAFRQAELREDPTAEWLERTLARFGQHFDEEILTGQWTIDPTPPGSRLAVGVRTVGMRYVPYNGPGAVPDWLRVPPSKRRVCVSLGLSGAVEEPAELISALVTATADLDVEVVLTEDPALLDVLPELPGKFRLAGFVPLNDLLPTCAAIVHHGGPGTLTSAQLHAVPQVVFGQTSITEVSAELVEKTGAGLSVAEPGAEVLRDAITRVVTDPSFLENARRVRAEMLAEASPRDIVPVLEKLTEEHRSVS